MTGGDLVVLVSGVFAPSLLSHTSLKLVAGQGTPYASILICKYFTRQAGATPFVHESQEELLKVWA